MKSHEIDYYIHGAEMQALEIELDTNETVIAEAGALSWMDDGIAFETKMGDGADTEKGFFGKLKSVGSWLLSGESLFMTHFTNQTPNSKKKVAFAAPYPGKIMPINLADHGGEITCQNDAFLCAARGTSISVKFNKRLGSGFFGGEGFILQSLKGDGMAFLHAGGTIVERELHGETLKIDTGCIVGFSGEIDYDIERAGSLKSMLFGGEGLFLATLRGHGKVYLQSLPFKKLAERIASLIPRPDSND